MASTEHRRAHLAERNSLGEWVAQELRGQIANGELKPGEHVREAVVAEALGTSRGPVREGFALLSAEGHLEIRPNRGAFVCVLTQRDVEEVHTLRVAIETLAAERATTRLTLESIAEMDRMLETMKIASDSMTPQEIVDLDLEFHTIIYKAAEHSRLLRVWMSVRNQVAFFLKIRNVNFPDFATVGFSEHLELRNALASGDPSKARSAAEAHVTGAYTRLRRLDLPHN